MLHAPIAGQSVNQSFCSLDAIGPHSAACCLKMYARPSVTMVHVTTAKRIVKILSPPWYTPRELNSVRMSESPSTGVLNTDATV